MLRALHAALLIAACTWTSACSPAAQPPAEPSSDASIDASGDAPALSPAAPSLAGRLAGEDCLIIVLDALPARHLGCYGEPLPTSPEIDELAARSVRFTHAWSQTSWTLPSTVSLMTGLYQESHGVRAPDVQLADQAATLAEAFAGAGYATRGFTQNPYASASFGVGQGFQSLELMSSIDEVSAAGGRSADEALADAVLAALGPRGDGPPRFVYCHFRRPHTPYDPPPEERALFCDPAYDGPVTGEETDRRRHNKGEFTLGGKHLAQLRHLYLAGLRAADRQVGRILAGIRRESTLVLLLADHGEELDEHGHLGHNFTSFEEVVNIPMVWGHPAFEAGPPPGREVATPVMSIDVFPTLVELFGLDVKAGELPGRSLAAELGGGAGPSRPAVFTSSRWDRNQSVAAYDGRLKYVAVPARKLERLFDLQVDPGEQVDLSVSRPADLARLRALAEDWRSRHRRLGLDEPASIDAETDERLEALGYLGGER